MAVTSTENRYMDQVSGRTETMPDTDTQSALALAPGEEPPNFLTEDLSVEREWRGIWRRAGAGRTPLRRASITTRMKRRRG
jgi:hypothetical protein